MAALAGLVVFSAGTVFTGSLPFPVGFLVALAPRFGCATSPTLSSAAIAAAIAAAAAFPRYRQFQCALSIIVASEITY